LPKGSGSWIDALQFMCRSGREVLWQHLDAGCGGLAAASLLQYTAGSQITMRVIMACHANAALKVLSSGVTQDMVNVLSKFRILQQHRGGSHVLRRSCRTTRALAHL
jgi:hypothetical protein